jgi:hypothetical protein
MLLFSINKSRGYENPILDIIVIELCSTGGFPLEEACENFFQIQSFIFVIILLSFQCYCGECSSYIAVILPFLAFYFCSTYILYLVYYRGEEIKHKNMIETQRYINIQFLLMNEICRNCKNAE